MKCRVCKCTYERACANGCGWAPGEGDLCTNCAAVVEAIREYREVAYRFSWAALKQEADRPLASQRNNPKSSASPPRSRSPKHVAGNSKPIAKRARGGPE